MRDSGRIDLASPDDVRVIQHIEHRRRAEHRSVWLRARKGDFEFAARIKNPGGLRDDLTKAIDWEAEV